MAGVPNDLPSLVDLSVSADEALAEGMFHHGADSCEAPVRVREICHNEDPRGDGHSRHRHARRDILDDFIALVAL